MPPQDTRASIEPIKSTQTRNADTIFFMSKSPFDFYAVLNTDRMDSSERECECGAP